MKLGVIGVGRIGAHHAGVLKGLDDVEAIHATDVVPGAAAKVSAELGLTPFDTPEDLFRSGINGLIIASSTPTHPEFVMAALEAGIPTFCEKPVADNPRAAQELLDKTSGTDVPVHIGFHRRFDPGHVRAKEELRSGNLGFVHTIRSTVLDPAPPPAEYIAISGGIYHDCSVHDIDAIRWVSDSQVVEVFAAGGNRGEAFFKEAGDVDTGAAILRLEDGTIGIISNSRYNGGGYDVRLELHGSRGAVSAGLDDSYPMRSLEEGVEFPKGPPASFFMDRFKAAYIAELTAFTEVVAGLRESPCTIADAVETSWVAEACTVSLRENRLVRLDELR
ncbi:MAG: Gfo/Idh/MocA family oxidoreductase [Dermatophilaceae bacterium]|nr:Gfo/Idh/MocA family oxidoreductase [Dermatophilaceae bacterium]